MTENADRIEILKQKRLHLMRVKRSVKHSLTLVEAELGALVTGINVGDTISYAFGGTQKTGAIRRKAKVVGFETWVGDDSWTLHVMSIRRDGSEGAQMNVYPYQDYRKEVSE